MADPEHTPPEPERDRLDLVLEELHDVMTILETLSRRIAALKETLRASLARR